jgi:hypothetical protein
VADEFGLNKTRICLAVFRQLLKVFSSAGNQKKICYIGSQQKAVPMPSFSLLSLNTFGIPFYLSYWRMMRLVTELNRLNPAVLCLQEIQQNAYVPLLKDGLSGYSHLGFAPNRLAPKGGLVTAAQGGASRFCAFPHRGKWLSIGFADWALNKGVLVTELEIQGRQLVVMNTHLQANYLGDWSLTNTQTQIQLEQVKFLAELVRSQPADVWVFACGDFNFPRRTPPYDLLMAESGLTDALADDPRPTYQPFPLVPSKWEMSLDYFFYRRPSGESIQLRADIQPIENAAGSSALQRFLTDHCALVLNIG